MNVAKPRRPDLTIDALLARIKGDDRLEGPDRTLIAEGLADLDPALQGAKVRQAIVALHRSLKSNGHRKAAQGMARAIKAETECLGAPAVSPNVRAGSAPPKCPAQPWQPVGSYDAYRRKFGAFPASVEELTSIEFARSRTPNDKALSKTFASILDVHPLYKELGPQAFFDRVRIGLSIFQFFSVRWRVARRDEEPAEIDDATLDQINQVLRDLESRVDFEVEGGPDTLTDAVQSGRSIAIGSVHQGFHPIYGRVRKQINLPVLRIIKGGGPSSGQVTRMAARNDDPRLFLQALRAVGKTPHLIDVFTDGRNGATETRAVFGKTFQISSGLPALAYRSNAVLFHSLVLWENGRFKVRLTRGPDPSDHGTSQDYAAAFYDDAAGHYEAALLAAPENLRRVLLSAPA